MWLGCAWATRASDGADLPYALRRKFGYMGEPGQGVVRKHLSAASGPKERDAAGPFFPSGLGPHANPHRAGLADQGELRPAEDRFFLAGRRRPQLRLR